MATLRMLKGKWYARIYMPRGSKPSEKKIPLRTSDKRIAIERLNQVNEVEAFIRAGEEWSFPWLNDDGHTKRVVLTLSEAIDNYISARKSDNLRPQTLHSYQYALDYLSAQLGESFPIQSVSVENIDEFKREIGAHLSITSVNIILRNIRTFLYWLRDRELIPKAPKIKMIRMNRVEPIYVSDSEFKKICQKVDDEQMVQVFNFYRETGCRLSEPFYSDLEGIFMTIHAESAKGRRSRHIELNRANREAFLAMKSRFHIPEHAGSYKNGRKRVTTTHEIGYISKSFLAACRRAKIIGKKFHSLRHTFAVRKYLETRDIYEVSRLLGHTSVIVTEVYTKFDTRKLKQDFPSILTQNETA
ncbi:MAG: site-specific integrase [Candidatus Brocadiales bacterium]|nr:site-specific integrase [Candidatus Brocadiales bacterium]